MKIIYTKLQQSGSDCHAVDAVNSFNRARTIPLFNSVKDRLVKSVMLIGTATIAMCLSSCFIPYDNYGDNAATYRGYQNGYRINSLPSGYRSEYISGSTYYYHDGYYYRRSSNGYVVTEAPRGSRYYSDYDRLRQSRYSTSDQRDRQAYDRRESFSQLPSGYRTVQYRGQQYYKYGDRYYVREGGRYYVVNPPY